MGKDDKAPAEFKVSESQRWWTDKTTAVVTGGNKGIGWDICRILSAQGIKTVLAARDVQRGKEAVKKIQEITGKDNPIFAQLDIADAHSVEAFGAWAEQELKTIDILVNNAGLAYKGNAFGVDEAQQTMNVNYYGTRAVCERLTPLMKQGGRIVNVCSMAGKQRILRSQALKDKVNAASTPDDVSALAEKWLNAVRANSYSEEGWPGSMYGVSKLCEATYTRILGQQLQSKGITANACCPGYVATDMSSWQGYKHSSEGADTPAWLALLAPADATAQFFSERHSESF